MKISAKRWIGTLLVASMLQGCATQEGMVRVNNVAWYPNKVVDVDTILNTPTPSLQNIYLEVKSDFDVLKFKRL